MTESFGYDSDGLLTAAGRFTITRDAASGLPELVSANGFQMNRYFNGYGEVEGAETSLSGSTGFSMISPGITVAELPPRVSRYQGYPANSLTPMTMSEDC